MTFLDDYLRFNFHGLLNIIAGLLDLLVGFIVLSKNKKSPLNQSFFLFIVASSVWVICFGMMSLTKDLADAPFWVRLSYTTGVPLISPSIYLFSAIWTKTPNYKSKAIFGFALAIPIIIAVVFFFDRFFLIEEFSWGRYNRVNGSARTWILMTAQLIHFFTYAMMAFWNFYRGWKTAPIKQDRTLYRSIFIAFLIAYVGSLDFGVTFGFDFYPFGYIALSLFLYYLSYVIMRHRLLDINLAFKKASLVLLVYGLLLSVTVPFLLAFFRHQYSLVGNQAKTILWVGMLLGLWLSLGPFIYAYFVRHRFWLKSKLSMGITHELKSPVGSILSSVEILKDQLAAKRIDRESTLQYADMIERNAGRLNLLVRDLLSLARIQDTSVEVLWEPCDMKDIIREVIDLYAPAAQQKSIRLDVTTSGNGAIMTDKEKMKQVISNLVSNALKFSPENSTVQVTLRQEKDALVVEVRDQGCGIPEEYHEKIFERFFQVNPNTKGSGIGLTIAKAWVEAHGGKIWAESEGERKGTKIAFILPL